MSIDLFATVRQHTYHVLAGDSERHENGCIGCVAEEALRGIEEQLEAATDALRRIDHLVGAALSDEEMYEAVTDLTRPHLEASTPASEPEAS